MINSFLDRLKPEPPENETFELIRVKANDLRRTAICVISHLKAPQILLDGKIVRDYSAVGPLQNDNLETIRNFEIRDGDFPVMGFHNGVANTWFCGNYQIALKQCRANGWVE